MELLPELLNTLDYYLWAPVSKVITGLFNFNGRMSLIFFAISYLTAYGLFRYRRHHGLSEARSFWAFIGGRHVHLHPSALLDYKYFLLRGVFKLVLMVPVVALVDPYIWRSGDYVAFFTNLWGARPQLAEHTGLMMLYGLGVFLLGDLNHYWVHRIFHSRWLWEFHKVHHAAEVLVPATAVRVHFVEKAVEKILDLLVIGLFAGAFFYLCGGKVSKYTLFGVTYIVFIFNALASNLRHSHVWLSFGPRIERWINSPAQHQIHHSSDPKHFNRNFGTNLSVWDRMFGTLYVTTHQPEPLTFGVSPRENAHYLTLRSTLFRPFLVTGRKLIKRLPVLRRRPGS